MKKVILPPIVAVTFLFLGYVVYALFFIADESFPDLKTGNYLGCFSGEVLGAEPSKVYFSIEVQEKSPNLLFVLYRSGWGSKIVQSYNVSDNSAADKEFQPVILTGPEGVLRFSGQKAAPEYASGKVVNVSNGKEAEWELFSSASKAEEHDPRDMFSQILSLRAEQDNLEMQLNRTRKFLEDIDAEESRISKVLSDGPTLQQKAQTRFTEKQSEIDKLTLELAQEEKTLAAMQAALDVARSVTQRGRLTTMARESLAREFRAINYKLSSEARENDTALMAELTRAQEALALQKELASLQTVDLNSQQESLN